MRASTGNDTRAWPSLVTAPLFRREVFGPAIAMGFACCASVCVSAPAEDVLGRHAGDPVHAGFFFSEGKFVAPPYVVERSGTAILINGIKVRSGRRWPSAKAEDPGDPPPGSRADGPYWERKWYFLRQRLPYDLNSYRRW